MQYLNQTIVFLSEENGQLKQKIRKLQTICKNLVQANNISTQRQQRSIKSFQNDKQSNLNQRQYLNSTSRESPSQFIISSIEKSQNQKPLTYKQYILSTKSSQPSQEQRNHEKSTLYKQIQSLTQELHKIQVQSLQKSKKLKQLTEQYHHLKEQNMYLSKCNKGQIENLKRYYQVVLIKQLQQKHNQELQQIKSIYQNDIQQKKTQINQLSELLQAAASVKRQRQAELKQKCEKQNRMMTIIKQMKYLLQKRQSQTNNHICALSQQLKIKNTQLQNLQQSLQIKSFNIVDLKNQNNQFKIQLKRLNQILSSLKRQHQRSLSKNQRQLIREKSRSNSIIKNYQQQRKYLQGQIKKKQQNQKYRLKKQKQLINKIKSIQQDSSDGNSQFISKSTLDQRQIENYHQSPSVQVSINRKNSTLFKKQDASFTKQSFSKYVNKTPSNNKIQKKNPQKKSTTPKSIIKLKSNTVGVINKKNIQNNLQSNLNLPHCESQKSVMSSRSFNNSLSLCLNDKKFHVSSPTEDFLSTKKNKNYLLSQESLEICNQSSIDALKDMSFFPSTKSSKINSEQKQCLEEFKYRQQLNELQQYMRASFNPNSQKNSFSNDLQQTKKHQRLPPTVSQFNIKPEQEEKQTFRDIHLRKDRQFQRQRFNQQELIKKLLKTQESNKKCQQTANLLTINQTARNNKSFEIQELILPKNNEKLQIKTLRNKLAIPELTLQYSNDKQNIYRPQKQLLRLSDLDTPCFQSSYRGLHQNSNQTKNSQMNSQQQKHQIYCQQALSYKQSRKSSRQDIRSEKQNLKRNTDDGVTDSKFLNPNYKKKININVHQSLSSTTLIKNNLSNRNPQIKNIGQSNKMS